MSPKTRWCYPFFALTGLWQQRFSSQIIELANQLVPGRNQIRLAYKTVYLYTAQYRFTPQATWSTRTVSTDAGVSGLNGKHLLWRPAFLWYKLLTLRHVYARRSSLWCANAGKARVCMRWDQKGDSYRGPTRQSILHLFIHAILAARRMHTLLQTQRRCNGAAETSQRSVKIPTLPPLWRVFLGRSELLQGSRQLDEAVKDRPLKEPCLRFIYWSQ